MIGLLLLAFGQVVELPREIKAAPHAFVTVRPTRLDGKQVKYFSPDTGMSVFPSEFLNDQTVFIFTAPPGRYRVYAVTAKGDAISPIGETVVIVGDAPTPPPGPGPNPNPGPGPNPDITTDPLFDAFAAVAGGLQENDQKANLTRLANTWAKVPEMVTKSKTLGEVQAAVRREQTAQGMPIGALIPIRERIWEEFANGIGNDPNLPMNEANASKVLFLAARLSAIFRKLGA